MASDKVVRDRALFGQKVSRPAQAFQPQEPEVSKDGHEINILIHHLPPQIFASGNEVATRNRRRKRGCCQKLLPPYLLPPSAATNFRFRKRGRHEKSPSKTRLLSETAATISTSTICRHKFSLQKRGRHEKSSSKTRLLSETVATIST
ncbi:hypothetical protein Tco_0761198, partial [Tanacetum coccineum]